MNEVCLRDTVLEVDLDSIAYNVKAIRKMVGNEVAIAAVVKSNGYGHGALDIAPTIMENGGDYLAVATLTEALELREKYEKYRIFIMGYTPNEQLEYIVKGEIIQTIFSLEQGIILNELGKRFGKKPIVHIKYDTGFNRLGFQDNDQSIEEIKAICRLENLHVEGIFSHFALAGVDEDKLQYEKFISAISKIEEDNFKFKYKHICDSIAGVNYPQYRLDMIRAGAIIYGLKSYRSDELKLKQAVSFKSKIYHIKKIKKGEGVSYNYKWRAPRDTIVGTMPFGYSDGYPRNMTDKGYVTIKGKKAPLIGVICMDQSMVDLTDLNPVAVGDEVIIYGDGSNNSVSIQEASELGATNKNEIVCRITRRTPRIYKKSGKIVKVLNYL
ncbi:MAG: alanine racemase [Anaeromicrobium sp.]|jgi:alanine racemase|uniref:alanine racemase n=1 Tax=Anaeromicrobium sp. TaxID=1929132 RepID=UPI0025EA9BFF|nr:alanine racemase [Anaeromicrobium sp.]MCT4593994.1 alanine racemase [Anaeromicrobium sp.]